MNITLNPAISANMQSSNSSQMRKNVQFKGALGERFVKEIETVQTPNIIKELKGTFGLKTEKVQDVLESFLEGMRSLIGRNRALEQDLSKARTRISEIPALERAAAEKAADEKIQIYSRFIKGKDDEIAAKERELCELRKEYEKYKPVVAVKSVDEVTSVMPDQALQIFRDMIVHKAEANKSMFDFLMTGKGQENALAQIERNNTLMKAREDGIMDILSVKQEYDTLARENSIYYTTDQEFTLHLIENALKSDPKGEYLSSSKIKEQVRKNAMAILTPMADQKYCNTDLHSIETRLDARLDNVIKFHTGFKNGIEKTKKDCCKYKDLEIIFDKAENDVDKSTVTIKYTDREQPVVWKRTYDQIAMYGNTKW